MKLTRLFVVLASLLVALLAIGCGDLQAPVGIDLGEPKIQDSGDENWRVPQPCPPGTRPGTAHRCIPEAPPQPGPPA